MKFFYWITKNFFYLFFKVFYHLKIYGLERIPKGAAVLAANHASFFDPPVISASMDDEVYFLARSSLFEKNFFFKLLIENLNAYPVAGTASDLKSFKTLFKLLKEGKKIVIFPEGFRSFDDSLSEIKSGVGMLAVRANCPIVPVYLHGTYEAWPRQSRFPKFFGTTIYCVFGKPLYPEKTLDNKKIMQELLAQNLEESFKHLKNWIQQGAKGDLP